MPSHMPQARHALRRMRAAPSPMRGVASKSWAISDNLRRQALCAFGVSLDGMTSLETVSRFKAAGRGLQRLISISFHVATFAKSVRGGNLQPMSIAQ